MRDAWAAVVYVPSTGDCGGEDRLHVVGFPTETAQSRWFEIFGPRIAAAGEIQSVELAGGTVYLDPLTFTPTR